MSAWIFQGNPDRFNVDQYLSRTSGIYWSVTRPAHNFAIGEHAFIWRAKGHAGGFAGIVARATIIEEPRSKSEVQHPELLSEFLWQTIEKEVSEVKVGLALEEVRLKPTDGMLTVAQLLTDPILSRMQIIAVRTGTNFKLTADEYNRLDKLWSNSESVPEYVNDVGYSSKEGEVFYRIHKARERDPKLVRLAKEEFFSRHGNLYCELCGFSFKKKYGDQWNEHIEAHHTKPIRSMSPREETHVKDLLMVCPNCHRAIHQGDPEQNLLVLKDHLGFVKPI